MLRVVSRGMLAGCGCVASADIDMVVLTVRYFFVALDVLFLVTGCMNRFEIYSYLDG